MGEKKTVLLKSAILQRKSIRLSQTVQTPVLPTAGAVLPAAILRPSSTVVLRTTVILPATVSPVLPFVSAVLQRKPKAVQLHYKTAIRRNVGPYKRSHILYGFEANSGCVISLQ